MYPQGCDVCNHLSLFLCVADYDKLLPGANGDAYALYACFRNVSRNIRCMHSRASCICLSVSCYTSMGFHCFLLKSSLPILFIGDILSSYFCISIVLWNPGLLEARLEPLCAVHDRSCEQGSEEIQVFGCVPVDTQLCTFQINCFFRRPTPPTFVFQFPGNLLNFLPAAYSPF